MGFGKNFLGEEQQSAAIDESVFNSLFSTGMNKNLFIIKSKVPLPHQDKSHQHVHDNFEFTVPLSHSPQLLIENNQFILPRRNIFPCNPGQYHGPAEAVHQHRILAFQFVPHDLEEISSLLFGKRDVEFENTPASFDLHLEKLINLFIYESQNKQAGYELILEHLSSTIGAYILRTLKSNLNKQEKNVKIPREKDIIKTLDFLQENFNHNFSLTDIADAAGLSKYHFIRVFKKETGKTPYQYYMDIKIEKAVELIKTHKYTITEVCFMCGFKNHSHFSRIFQKKMGMTPSRFKTLCQ